MKVIASRKSLPIEDEIKSQELEIDILSEDTFSKIFRRLITDNYFPVINAKEGVWTLFIKQPFQTDLVSWKVQSDIIFTRYISEEPRILDVNAYRNVTHIYFEYYASELQRAEYIYKMFDGQKFHIWHEGFMSEYESYHISELEEANWKSDISK